MRLSEFKLQAGIAEGDVYFLDLFHDASFLLEMGPGDPEVYVLKPHEMISGGFVGRNRNCCLRLIREEVSTLHAQLVAPLTEEQSWRVVDLNSTNGTFIEEVALDPAVEVPLADEQQIRFGKRARFRFLSAKGLLQRMRRLGRKSTAPIYLCSDLFNPMQLEFDRPMKFGRGADSTIVLPHSEVSRHHCEIERRPDGVFLRDLGSRNGTWIGETQIADDEVELALGDRVSLGPFDFVIRGPEELEAAGITPESLGSTTRTIAGNLIDMPLVDLLQSILDKQRSGVLKVNASDESHSGRVRFEDGTVCEAHTEAGLNGTIAVRAILQAREGKFVLHTDDMIEPAGPQQITTTLESLLLEEYLSAELLETEEVAVHG